MQYVGPFWEVLNTLRAIFIKKVKFDTTFFFELLSIFFFSVHNVFFLLSKKSNINEPCRREIDYEIKGNMGSGDLLYTGLL